MLAADESTCITMQLVSGGVLRRYQMNMQCDSSAIPRDSIHAVHVRCVICHGGWQKLFPMGAPIGCIVNAHMVHMMAYHPRKLPAVYRGDTIG
jgi:hypothetical protein